MLFAGGSFTFRSILHGRDLLREGAVWRTGNGSKVLIHHDNWIPRKGCLRPLGQTYIHGTTRVADLLNGEGDGWNHVKVDEMFTPDDAQDIKQILVGGNTVDDFMAWNYTKDGVYTVRSGYHLLMNLRKARSGRPESSSSVSNHRSWLALWARMCQTR